MRCKMTEKRKADEYSFFNKKYRKVNILNLIIFDYKVFSY